MHYLAKRTQDTYKDVVLPLSAPTSHDHLTMAHLGVGRMDMTRLVPPWFHAAGETFIPDPLGWKSALVLEGSSTPVHHDHMLAGQVTFHSFGHKVRFHCQSKNFYMSLLLTRFGSYAHPTSTTWRCGPLITFTEQETKPSYLSKILWGEKPRRRRRIKLSISSFVYDSLWRALWKQYQGILTCFNQFLNVTSFK